MRYPCCRKSFDGKLTINLSELDFVAFCRDYAEKVNNSGEYPAKVVFDTTLGSLAGAYRQLLFRTGG